MENAADTFPVGVNPGAPAGLAGGCGIVVRDGGVSGAPNIAPVDAVGRASGTAAPEPVEDFGFSTGGAGAGDESLTTVGVNFGEKGGVRWRTGAGDWLGTAVGAGRWDTGAGPGGAAGAGGAERGIGSGGAAGAGGAERGIGGGQAFAGAVAAGVFERMIGLTPVAEEPGAGAADDPLVETWRSSPQLTAAPTGISPPHTEHRALIETLVIFAGSSRKTERHSGQETFI